MKASYKIELVDINQIILDKNNPRIAKFIEMYGEKITAEQISLALGVGDSSIDSTGTTFQSLKASIKTNGGIIHPIIVNRTKDDEMIVIEGNTRVAIYKEFLEKKLEGSWDKILAIVYNAMQQDEIDAIRLQAHLVGPRPWDPYSKAKYLEFLRNKEHLTFSQIVDYCGGNQKEVESYIEAYLTMEAEYRPLLNSDDEFDPTRFSAFVELEKNRRIKDAVISAGFTLKDFSRWIIDQKIHPLNTVRSLPLVLSNTKSKDVFVRTRGKGAIQKALQVISTPTSDETLLKNASLFDLVKECINKIDKFPYEELRRLKSDDKAWEIQDIITLKERVVDLCDELESL